MEKVPLVDLKIPIDKSICYEQRLPQFSTQQLQQQQQQQTKQTKQKQEKTIQTNKKAFDILEMYVFATMVGNK